MSTLVFDGDCGFCTTSVRAMRRLGLRADTVIAWQHADLAALGLTEQACSDKLQWVDDAHPPARISSGHEAIAQLMIASGWAWALVGRLLLVPGISWIAARVYAWVSAHRQQLPGGTPACALERPPASTEPPGDAG